MNWTIGLRNTNKIPMEIFLSMSFINSCESAGASMAIDYHDIITLEPGKRSGKPCIRGLRISVYDVLIWLADGMSREEILDDFPELNNDDITACLLFAADRERYSLAISAS